jgi:hypothetical protein
MKINDIKENHGHPGQLYRFAMVDESGQMHRSKPMPAEECKVWLHKAKHMHNPEYMTIYPAHDVDQKLTIDEVMMQHPNMAHDLAEDNAIQVKSIAGSGKDAQAELSNGTKVSASALLPGANNTVAINPQATGSNSMVGKNLQQPTSEGFFGTSEEELAKDPSPAGDYYRKLVALKKDPRWAGKQDLIQKRIQDLINRIDLDQGVPQPGAGQAAGPETDPAKFQQKNPSFHEGKHKDTIAQGGGDVGGDATDNFIKQVKDRAYEKANRNGADSGQRSPVAQNKKLKETDELYKWLTIAGIK